MPAFFENEQKDTSNIKFPPTGIRLMKFVRLVFGEEVLEQIKKGELILFFRGAKPYDRHFRDHRVKEDSTVTVRHQTTDADVPEDYSF